VSLAVSVRFLLLLLLCLSFFLAVLPLSLLPRNESLESSKNGSDVSAAFSLQLFLDSKRPRRQGVILETILCSRHGEFILAREPAIKRGTASVWIILPTMSPNLSTCASAARTPVPLRPSCADIFIPLGANTTSFVLPSSRGSPNRCAAVSLKGSHRAPYAGSQTPCPHSHRGTGSRQRRGFGALNGKIPLKTIL